MNTAKEWACDGKIRYRSLHRAEKQLKRLRKGGRTAINAYACPHCKGYHIGHMPGFGTFMRRLVSRKGKVPHH